MLYFVQNLTLLQQGCRQNKERVPLEIERKKSCSGKYKNSFFLPS